MAASECDSRCWSYHSWSATCLHVYSSDYSLLLYPLLLPPPFLCLWYIVQVDVDWYHHHGENAVAQHTKVWAYTTSLFPLHTSGCLLNLLPLLYCLQRIWISLYHECYSYVLLHYNYNFCVWGHNPLHFCLYSCCFLFAINVGNLLYCSMGVWMSCHVMSYLQEQESVTGTYLKNWLKISQHANQIHASPTMQLLALGSDQGV